MRRIAVALSFAFCLSALSATAVFTPWPAQAEKGEATFLIPAGDGYGIADCLSSANDCGKVIADGYCEANGFARARSFGPVKREDITGSIETLTRRGVTLSITCEG